MSGKQWGPRWGHGEAPRPGAAQKWSPPTGSTDGQSGTHQTTSTTGDSSEGARDEKRLCQATFPVPTPCTVHIGVSNPSGSRASWDYVAEIFDAVASQNLSSAKLIFEYGAGAARRRVECDLRPGAYQLPPCDQVTVSVSFFNTVVPS